MFLVDYPLQNWAFEIFGQRIYWYAIFILTGALLAFALGFHFGKKTGISFDTAFEGFTWGLIVGVLGARIYYVLFDPNGSISTIWEFFNIRGGGLAIHGAVIATAIYAPLYCKLKKINILVVIECVAPGFLLAQAVGRWGNFFNQEAHGGLVPGATLAEQRAYLEGLHLPEFIINQMLIQGGSSTAPVTGYYHPTFLYESLLNILGLIIYMVARRFIKKLYLGDSVAFYLVWYGGVRFFIEGMRTDPLYIGDIKVARLISILFIIAGVAIFVLRRVFKFALISNYDTFYKARDIEVSNS